MARLKTDTKNIYYDDSRKLYYVNFNYGKGEDGKNVRITKTYSDLKLAKKELVAFEKKKARDDITIPKKETVTECLTHWVDVVKGVKCAATTLYGYKIIVNKYIIPYMGEKPMQSIKSTDIENYFLFLKDENLSITTIRKHYDLLKSVFTKARKEKLINENPFDNIEPIKPQRSEPKFYTPEMLGKLISVVNGDRMEIVIKLAGLMGMRREEIAGLKWDKIDMDNRELTVSEVRTQAGKVCVTKDTKSESSYRKLDIPEDIYELLKNIKDRQNQNMVLLGTKYIGGDYVMSWQDGQPYRPNYISDLFKELLTKNDLPPIRLHDLRHTFASIANSMGVSLYDISKALGHSEVSTTSKIYTHSFETANQKAIKSVSDSLKK